MKELTERVEALKHSEVRKLVDARMAEFALMGSRPIDAIFNELCFCLLTANFNADRAIKIQKEIGNGFIMLTESQLVKKLKELGHRFPATRAAYIVEARKHKDALRGVLHTCGEREAREWLVKNVKGLGHKEASHFLRNVGRCNCAVIDFHIIDLLGDYGLILPPKTLTPAKYLEIEKVLEKIAGQLHLSLAELDLYLWYLETGKVLK